MDVLVKRSYRGGKGGTLGQEADYGFSSSTVTVVEPNLKSALLVVPQYIDPTVLYFSETDTPSIENYNVELGGVYGEHPSFKLLVYDDDGNEQEVQQVPKRYRTDNVLTRIAWDEYPLPTVCSGKIIISK